AVARGDGVAVVDQALWKGQVRACGELCRGSGRPAAIRSGPESRDLGHRRDLEVVDRRVLDHEPALRQVERERAALARFALGAYLPAQQPGDLAADRQAQSGAAVTAARRAVALLERL